MTTLEILFWIMLFTVFYTYLGYGILMFIIIKIRRLLGLGKSKISGKFEPKVTLVVPAYNEEDFIEEKVKNSLELDYPKDKLEIIFITDGSSDGTVDKLKKLEGITLLHDDRRAGKSAAENRAMQFVKSPFVVFCDANTYLNKEAIRELVKHYENPKVGGVSGEKRIYSKDSESASGAGEGIYWKYESTLKKFDSELHTIVGAAGELVSFRSELVQDLEEDTILDDFIQSMRIVDQGYRFIYEPNAYAMETPSDSVEEELKRKIRIAAGGWQAMSRLKRILNPFNQPIVFFEYVSHRVLRWSITPVFLILMIIANIALLQNDNIIYMLLIVGQAVFYASAMLGWYLENKKIRMKILFVPYYFFIMNYAVLAGLGRFIKGSQKATWERAKRATA